MKIYELLDSPEKWTQGDYARTKRGRSTDATSRSAVCWCLVGAAEVCYGADIREYRRVFYHITKKHPEGVSAWNDAPARTYADVVALCRELDI